jgi:hypothetical protein
LGGEFGGQTGPKTRKKVCCWVSEIECNAFFCQANLQNLLQIAEAAGGIEFLFVDEAAGGIIYVMNSAKVAVMFDI